ncbi:TIGR03016 family PEP-CTERM system-associated outer membrane protein [Roseateles toxinivorans]|nr:TIGR03016 family PEP-CTERM system-associated outer membrane protein [Roseateles toxinivorans]
MSGRMSPVPQALRWTCALALTSALSGMGHAQEASAEVRRSFALEPRVSSTVTLTNHNSRLGADVQDRALIVQLSPGLRLSRPTGRVKGFLDYALTGSAYLKSPAGSDVQNALSASLSAEVIDNWAFADLTASITQQAISAFGVQSVDRSQLNANQAEVWNLRVSPYVKGTLAGFARYEARVNVVANNTRNSSLADSSTAGLQLSLGGLSERSLVTWSADASVQHIEFKQGRVTDDGRARAVLSYVPIDDWRLSLNGGVEANNFVSTGVQRHAVYGVGLNWTPTERTKLSVQRDRRFFGQGHSLSFEHRFPRSIIRFSDSKDASANTGQGGGSPQGSNYDLFYQLFASLEPDPVKRDVYVRAYLQANGINPSAAAAGGFLSSAVTLLRRQELAYALTGVRDTVTLSVTRTESRRLDSLAQVQDDLSGSGLVRQQMISLSLAHRLTPLSAINLMLSRQQTRGALANQSSTMNSILANWTTTLGPRTTLVLGSRLVNYRATLAPYKEKAGYATLTRQF